jgi:ribosome-binding factor A
MSVRTEKVGSLIKEELGIIIQRNFSMSEFGFVTVTDVLMSPDLRIAKVYVSIYGDKNRKSKSFAMLEANKSSIRSLLGQAVRLRYTPEIIFNLDETIDKAMKLEKIFKTIHEQKSNKEEESKPTEA